jgi:hypothetical protein
MSNRRAVSVLETLVVIAIVAVLIGMLLPAVGAARRRAMETVCKNNLRQINLAVAQFVEINKRLPDPGNSGVVGGWTIEVLPFLDQKNLRDRITPGEPLAAAPDFLLGQPRIFMCPIRAAADTPDASAMDHAHYILVPVAGRQSYDVFDAPLDVEVPWASGPEMAYADVVRQTGPHNQGFFIARGFQNGVDFIPNSQEGPRRGTMPVTSAGSAPSGAGASRSRGLRAIVAHGYRMEAGCKEGRDRRARQESFPTRPS